MNRVKPLYDLQSLDLEIEAKQQALAKVEGQLGEREALIAASQALDEAIEQLASLEKRQRDLEWQVEDLGVKIASEEEKLYGGRVRSPKELEALQQDVEGLKLHRSRLEDELLDIMTRAEALGDQVDVQRKELASLEAEWRDDQARLQREQTGLLQALEVLGTKREALVAQIRPEDVGVYEHLRRMRPGAVVASVEQGMCRGCRVSLPTSTMQQIRLGQALVQCSNCGRILYSG